MMPDCIWVTGASGFIGRHLVNRLRQSAQYKVVALTRQTTFVENADHTYQVDITETDQLKSIVEAHRPVGIYHLAGMLPPADEPDMFRVNVQGTYSLLHALYSAGSVATTVLMLGSAAEYMPREDGYYDEGCEIGGGTPYGRSKSAQTILGISTAKRFGIDLRIARPFNLLGAGLPSALVAGNICAQLSAGKTTLRLGNVASARDFVDVRDAIEAFIKIYDSGEPYEIYNVATGKAVTIVELVEEAGRVFGVSPEILSDTWLVKKQDFNIAYGNPDKLKTSVGWKPERSLADAIKSMADNVS
ncbi:MAG: NAD(P)-dependent oxidoreductase [Ketobacteraceae bacterium]|nr:NAD(P)-dependent oxidoreductase [Ketobacteraceae bacterium]